MMNHLAAKVNRGYLIWCLTSLVAQAVGVTGASVGGRML